MPFILPRCWNRKVTSNAIGFDRRAKSIARRATVVFFLLSLFLFFSLLSPSVSISSPGEARFGNDVRATRTVVDDIQSATRTKTGSSCQRQDKRQVISLFTT